MKKITRTFERIRFTAKIYNIEKDDIEVRDISMIMYDTKNGSIAKYEEDNKCKVLSVTNDIKEKVLIGVDYDIFINNGEILKVIGRGEE